MKLEKRFFVSTLEPVNHQKTRMSSNSQSPVVSFPVNETVRNWSFRYFQVRQIPGSDWIAKPDRLCTLDIGLQTTA